MLLSTSINKKNLINNFKENSRQTYAQMLDTFIQKNPLLQ